MPNKTAAEIAINRSIQATDVRLTDKAQRIKANKNQQTFTGMVLDRDSETGYFSVELEDGSIVSATAETTSLGKGDRISYSRVAHSGLGFIDKLPV